VKPGEFVLNGYKFTQLHQTSTYKEKTPVQFARLEVNDLQDMIRYLEVSGSSSYCICVIEGIFSTE
jgi:hypothetical protein